MTRTNHIICNMESIKFYFWLKLALVVITSFIVITYIFKPADNQCQMTFMMEPPRFVPIPIDKPLYNLDSPHLPQNSDQIKTFEYKLYMYSEFGFPLENDVRKDLRDSMPVLFVPGNAGSYQQVRSLASTCIRRQLQALDAFKFIFYTIDFCAQLSGLSGDLIEDQIDFLNLAINQIVKIHPTETNGVIVIGHSVGGFVAKALLARSHFDTNLVPLLINLASPLTRPFISFDHKMQILYDTTNARWGEKRHNSTTLTISISGGKSDRLVPAHLSLDPQYDLSLTTSSIDGVWLATDHVSITWCRELMNKLSRLLSSLMDKRHTKLIKDKTHQLDRVEGELYTLGDGVLNIDQNISKTEPKVISENHVMEFYDQSLFTREDLLKSTRVMDLSRRAQGDLLIWIEHIDTIKDASMYGCLEVSRNANQIRCTSRTNLIEYFRTIPSRRHQLKKKSLLISDDDHKLRYLVLDFASSARDDPRKSKIPEAISVQIFKKRPVKSIHVPHLSSYLLSRIFRSSNQVLGNYKSLKQPMTYIRYEIVNLNQANQYYDLIVESKSCATGDIPSETSALLTQDRYVSESFYTKGNLPTVIIKLDPYRITLMDRMNDQTKLHLELFLDGSCEHEIKIEFDMWSLIENLIQTYPGEIIACSCYLAFCSVLLNTWLFLRVNCNLLVETSLVAWALGFAGFILIYMTSRLYDSGPSTAAHQIALFCLISILSSGLIALVEYMVNRLVDLAIIVNSFQTLIRDRIVHLRRKTPGINDLANSNGSTVSENQKKQIRLDYEWPVMFLSAIGGLYLSETLMRLSVLFIMLRLKLNLSTMKPLPESASSDAATTDETRLKCKALQSSYKLALSVTIICMLSSICSLPTALLMINSAKISTLIDVNYLACLGSMISAKSICLGVEAYSFKQKKMSERTTLQQLLAYAPKHLYALALLPMMMLSRNIRMINFVELISLIWVASRISKLETRTGKRKTD